MFSISYSSTLVSSGILLNTSSSSTVAEGSTSHFPAGFPLNNNGVPKTNTVKSVDARDVLEKLRDDVHTRLRQHIKSKL